MSQSGNVLEMFFFNHHLWVPISLAVLHLVSFLFPVFLFYWPLIVLNQYLISFVLLLLYLKSLFSLLYYNTFDAPCQASKSYIYRCAVSRGSSRIHFPDTTQFLNITMDITHGLLFVGVW